MRALVIGRGAMGKRRIRDLKSLGVEVASWDIEDTGDPSGWKVEADALIVCSPPLTHRQFVKKSVPTFTEADCEYVPDPHFASCTPRFNPTIRQAKERLSYPLWSDADPIGAPVAYTLHVGQNLADWHPGADLATYYAAQRKTGACREMVPFELGWLTWIFGPVTKAKALRANTAHLAAIDDVYQVVLEHAGATGSAPVLGHLLIDAVSRPPIRRLHVVGTAGTFTQDIRYTEAVYLAEMRAFVESVEGGKPWPYSLAEEKHCLDVLHMIERFS